MMLMNSTKRAFLVGEQVRGAPYLDQFGVEALPTGYVVCAPGGRVGEVGGAELIQASDVELVHAYALCAKMFGFSLLYLEAGSGAERPFTPTSPAPLPWTTSRSSWAAGCERPRTLPEPFRPVRSGLSPVP